MNKNLINHPYISVIMSVYNESNEELTKSIKSVLEQSYTDYEFITNSAMRSIIKRTKTEKVKK